MSQLDVAPEYDLAEMLEFGCHFGHQAKKWHPKMDPWIYGQKNGVHIFDLTLTAQQLQHAYNYAYQLGQTGKKLVFVGTKRQAKEIIAEVATQAKIPYITSRWLGGLLTNWAQVSDSLKRMLKIEDGLKTGMYDSYTKYERVQLEKEATKLGRFFDGIRDLKSEPEALFIVDPGRENVAVKEAITKDVPIIALIDSNTDPRPVTLPIPANDDSYKSIRFIVEQVAAGYAAGRKAA